MKNIGPSLEARSEPRHVRANRITVEAAQIARRDGQTPAERIRIYEREIARLSGEVATTE